MTARTSRRWIIDTSVDRDEFARDGTRGRISLTATAVATGARRLVTLRLGERFAFRLWSDHIVNLSQHSNEWRQEVAITV